VAGSGTSRLGERDDREQQAGLLGRACVQGGGAGERLVGPVGRVVVEEDAQLDGLAGGERQRLVVGVPGPAGEGVLVEGPIAAILLLLTGRDAALAQLSGPGAARVRV
jgi:hypothetical protein